MFDELNDAVESPAVEETPVGAPVYGSKSDTVAYVAPLGDPSRIDLTIIKDKETQQEKERKRNPRFVGHRFRALADMTIPNINLRYDKNNLMDYDPETFNRTRQVQAGEEFDLTLFECGYLFAQPEFNTKVTGGDIKVAVTFRDAKKDAGTMSINPDDIPTVSLRVEGGGSIKDLPPIDVLKYEEYYADEAHKVLRKNRTMLPGFEEKFGALAKPKERAKSAAAAPKTSANVRNAAAVAFLQAVEGKMKAN